MRLGPATACVVTGGAGGIGRALVEGLLRRGARVAALDSDPAALRTLVEEFPAVLGWECDVAEADQVAAAHARVEEAYGRVDLLVNCAGISVAGEFERVALDDLRRVLEVNYWGTVLVSRAFLPLVREAASHGGATLCNILSDFALVGMATKSGYTASKWAVRGLTEALTLELADAGVRVMAVYPGATATNIVRRGRALDPAKQGLEARYLDRGLRPEYVARRILRSVERSHTRVLIGWDARLLDLAARISPGVTRWALRHLWKRVPFL